jgi:hypothetical protein
MRVLGFLLLFAAVVIGSLAVRFPIQAAESACKGLATEACAGNAGCSWVKPHKTKKGKDIAGFCRKKASRQSEPKAPAKG